MWMEMSFSTRHSPLVRLFLLPELFTTNTYLHIFYCNIGAQSIKLVILIFRAKEGSFKNLLYTLPGKYVFIYRWSTEPVPSAYPVYTVLWFSLCWHGTAPLLLECGVKSVVYCAKKKKKKEFSYSLECSIMTVTIHIVDRRLIPITV